MAASSGGPRRSSTRRRRLNAILLSIIGFVVLLMIIGALAGPHGTKPSSAQSNVTPTASTLATASINSAAVSQSAASPVRSTHAAALSSPRPASQRPATSRPSTRKPLPVRSARPTPTAAAPAGCYPKTNGGNCYVAGEYCRNSDHDMTGVAGNGEAIKCEDNNGWRWEPA